MPLAFIHISHGINFFAKTMLFVLLPLPFILAPIHIVMDPVARDVVLSELADILVAIVPGKDTLAVHFVFQVFTLVHVPFFIDLSAHVVLFVISPVSFLNLPSFRDACSPPLKRVLPPETLAQIHRPI